MSRQDSFEYSEKLLNSIDSEYKWNWSNRTEYIKTIEAQANFYKMERRIMEYAKVFYRNISFSNIVLDHTAFILPIVFVSRYDAIMEEFDSKSVSVGRLAIDPINNKRVCIRISLPARSSNNSLTPGLKRTIRHELIHYYLFINDLPYKDDTALFWAYCYLFDAGAYMPLNEEEEEKYNHFLYALQDETQTPAFILTDLANAIITGDKEAEKRFNYDKEQYIAHITKYTSYIEGR